MGQRPSVSGTASTDPRVALNPRDMHVLRLLADGRSTGQIAASLSISRNTARTRIRRVEGKLEVSGRAAAVRAGRDLGVVGIPRPRSPLD